MTDRRTDGFAVAYTALAKLALRRAVKTDRWSGYLSGSSAAADKLSMKRTALNLSSECIITLNSNAENGVGSRDHPLTAGKLLETSEPGGSNRRAGSQYKPGL